MAGNRGFGDALTAGVPPGERAKRAPLPTDSVITSRSTTLGELASGKLVNDRTLWVDPARCRPWPHHNRDQALLDEDSCGDLIETFLSEGRQKFPAIVRRLKDDPDHDYEIIAGVRRHWTVGWLRTHNYPHFEFLVTVQALTDEEAFRVADIENRARQDISELERARDYLNALGLFYDGKQAAMAARLNVPPAWLSRLLELARLPAPIVACFADPRDLRVEHAKQLAPLLRAGPGARRMLEAAAALAPAQRQAREEGRAPARASEVVRYLQDAAVEKKARRKPAPEVPWLSHSGTPMLRAEPRRGGGVRLELLARSGATRAELTAAFAELLDRYPGDKPFG